MKPAVFAILITSLVLVGLSFLHPFGNPRVGPSQRPDALLQNKNLTPAARSVLITKCADCHSSATRWPIYSHIAPVSWLVERDIVEARKKMDLTQWERLSPDAQQIMLGKILHEARTGAMPPLQYRLVHRRSAITPADLTALSSLTTNAPGSEATSPGDFVRGKAVFEKRCTGCHALTTEREAPHLAGVYGRSAASVPGFDYSVSLKHTKIVWDELTLNQWLADPDTTVPENKMDFHLPKAQERADVIAFLKTVH